MSCVIDGNADGVDVIHLIRVVVEIIAIEMLLRSIDRFVYDEHNASSFLVVVSEQRVQKREIRHEPVDHNRSKRPDDHRKNQDSDEFTSIYLEE